MPETSQREPRASRPAGAGDAEGQATLQAWLWNLVFVIKERWLWALPVAVLATVGYWQWAQQEVPIYRAQASLLVEASERVLDIESVVDTSARDDATMENHQKILRSSRFQEFAEARLTPAQWSLLCPGQAAPEGPVGFLANRYTVRRDGAQGLVVAVENHSPAVAATLANHLAESYIAFNVNRADVSNDSALGFLQQQANQLQSELEGYETEMQQFRERNRFLSSEDGQGLLFERKRSLTTALTDIQVEVLTLQSQLSSVQTALAGGQDWAMLPRLASRPGVAELQSRLAALTTERTSLALRYLRRHPRMVANQTQTEEVQRLLAAELERAVGSMQNELAEFQSRQQRLAQELAVVEQQALELDRTSIQANILQRRIETTRETYAKVLDRLNETTLSSRLATTNVRLLEPSATPSQPISPNPLSNLVIAGLLFAGSLFGVAWSLDALDTRIKSAWDVEEFVGQTLLGDLPALQQVPAAQRGRLVLDDLDTGGVEMFRALYATIRLQVKTPTDGPLRLVVSSTLPGEGKSFVCVNLAATFAQHGHRTLIIDCDFRRPMVHRAFGLPNSEGILRPVSAHGSAKPTVPAISAPAELRPSAITEKLHVLRSGGSTSHSSEIIESVAFQTLIAALSEQYEVVIFDTPPVGLFPDPVFLAALSHGVVFVSRHNTVARSRVRQAVQRFVGVGGGILGILLNARTSSRGLRPGYGYQKGYAYDYYQYRNTYKYRKYYAAQGDDEPTSARPAATGKGAAASGSGARPEAKS